MIYNLDKNSISFKPTRNITVNQLDFRGELLKYLQQIQLNFDKE